MFKYHSKLMGKIPVITVLCFCLLRGAANCVEPANNALTWRDVLLEALQNNPFAEKGSGICNRRS